MASKFLNVLLLLALVALVANAQNATNEIDECIKRENCAANDRECRAACAGVPDPDPQVATETQTCYKKCADDHLPSDVPAYKDCTKECREEVYQEGVTEPGSPAPSKAQKSNGSGSEAGGDNESDSKSNDSESDEGDSSDDNGTEGNNTDESGASFSAKSAHVYVLAAVLACVAFTVGL